jgi:hypothetical protein
VIEPVLLCTAVAAVASVFADVRAAIIIWALCALTAGLIMQHAAGTPAMPDGRLAAEQWRLLAVAPVADSRFILTVRYSEGDIRSYDLNITDPGQRDEFLKAQQALKKGHAMRGQAKHGRAGLLHDDDMGFSFGDVPDQAPKGPPQ